MSTAVITSDVFGHLLGARRSLALDQSRLDSDDRLDQGVEPATVLLVDDEEDVRLLVSNILADSGYRVETAANGRDALRFISSRKPDLVLLDLMMPELDGWQVLAALRETNDSPPVLVLSAFCDDLRAQALGARGWVRKPFDYKALLDACSGALED